MLQVPGNQRRAAADNVVLGSIPWLGIRARGAPTAVTLRFSTMWEVSDPNPHLVQVSSVCISDKTDVKPKMVTRDKEGQYIMINGSINQEGKTIVNKYIYTQHQSI